MLHLELRAISLLFSHSRLQHYSSLENLFSSDRHEIKLRRDKVLDEQNYGGKTWDDSKHTVKKNIICTNIKKKQRTRRAIVRVGGKEESLIFRIFTELQVKRRSISVMMKEKMRRKDWGEKMENWRENKLRVFSYAFSKRKSKR